jgi:heme exporter protein B
VIPAAQTTARLLAGRPVAESIGWIKILLAFDLVFVAACTMAFPYTIED